MTAQMLAFCLPSPSSLSTMYWLYWPPITQLLEVMSAIAGDCQPLSRLKNGIFEVVRSSSALWAAVSVPYMTRIASDLAVIAFSIWLTRAPGSPLASVMLTDQLLSSPVAFSHCWKPAQLRWSDWAESCWATTASLTGLACAWARAGVLPSANWASWTPPAAAAV